MCCCGNDGSKCLDDGWVLDTAAKPYAWKKLEATGDARVRECTRPVVAAEAWVVVAYRREKRERRGSGGRERIGEAQRWDVGVGSCTWSGTVCEVSTRERLRGGEATRDWWGEWGWGDRAGGLAVSALNRERERKSRMEENYKRR